MNILLAIDDSVHSRNTAQFLNQIHFPSRSTLILLMVVEPATALTKTWAAQDALVSATHDLLRKQAWDLVKKMGEVCWQPGLKIVPLVAIGIPGATILDTIEQHEIDLTVLGTHGRTGCDRFLLGSVSEWVLTEAPCSVLIVRGQSDKTKKPGISRMKILVGVDGSEDAKAALVYMRQLKFPTLTQVTVCSTITEKNLLGRPMAHQAGKSNNDKLKQFSSKIQQAQKHTAGKMLDEYVDKLEKMGFRAQPKLTYGHPAEQLLSLAEGKQCNLIVVGSRGVTGLRKFFLGSVSNKVACHAPCSVLVVRKPSKSKTSKGRK